MPQNVHWRSAVAAIAAGCALAVAGCATYQGPRIDPTGESVFVWPGDPTVAAPPMTLAPAPVGAAPIGTPVVSTAPAFPPLQSVPPMVPSTPFGNVTAPPVYSDPPGMVPVTPLVGPAPGIATTVPTLPPPPVAGPAPAVGPAAPLPPPPFPPVLPTAAVAPYGKEYLRVVPEGLVAPVGSEMLVKAGIFAPEGDLISNQRIDWSINPTGVGQFTELGWRDIGQIFGFMEAPQRIDNWNATSTTAVVPITLNTSTPDPSDDIPIYRGEAWVSLTSPIEGTSVVTAIATAYSEFNQATSTIYWVDAQWLFPQPTVVEPGRSHTLTTTVMRRTDGAPLAGWVVHYDVSSGALGYEGGSFVESATDANGRASVEVTPKDAGGGTTTVGITVIRPPTAGPAVMPRLQLGRSVTTVSWAPGAPSVPIAPVGPPSPISEPPGATSPPTLPPNGAPQASPYSPPPAGPATQTPSPYTPQAATAGKPRLEATMRTVSTEQISVGGFASFELTVTNRGDGIARHVVVTDRFDRGLKHPKANPNENTVVYPSDSQMDLAPNESRTIPLTFTVVDGGTQCHVATVTADGTDPVTERGCITAKQAALELRIIGPHSRAVGETAEFSATVKNVGDVAATNIEIVMHCDAAITPTMAERGAQPLADNGFLLKIESLAPSERRTFGMQGQCRAPSNRACARVTMTADGGVNQADEACFEILPPAPGTLLPGGAAAPAASSNLRLMVNATKASARVGEKQLINVIIDNAGQQSETQVSMRVLLPAEFSPDSTQIQPPPAKVFENEIDFATIDQLPPGQQQRYVIPVTPNRVGQQVRVSRSNHGQQLI